MPTWESFKSAIAHVFNKKPNPPTEMTYDGLEKIIPTEGSEEVAGILARGHVLGNYFYVLASATVSIVAVIAVYEIFKLIINNI